MMNPASSRPKVAVAKAKSDAKGSKEVKKLSKELGHAGGVKHPIDRFLRFLEIFGVSKIQTLWTLWI